MDTLICISGDNYGLVVYNTENYKSILKMKNDMEKCIEIGKNKILIVTGNPGEVAFFCDYIQKTIQFYSLRTRNSISAHAAANLIRKQLASLLRKAPIKINITLLGFDIFFGPTIYTVDYTGHLFRSDFVVQGYPSYILSSVLHNLYESRANLETTLSILVKCVVLIKNRFLGNQQTFAIKMVDKNGCKFLGSI